MVPAKEILTGRKDRGCMSRWITRPRARYFPFALSSFSLLDGGTLMKKIRSEFAVARPLLPGLLGRKTPNRLCALRSWVWNMITP